MIGIGSLVCFAADGQILVGRITAHIPVDGGPGFTHYLVERDGQLHRVACLNVYNVLADPAKETA